MKTLNTYISERLNPKRLGPTSIAKQFPLTGAYQSVDLIDFAGDFNTSTDPEDSSWEDWEGVGVDSDWARDPNNHATVEYFCKLCSKMKNSKTLSIEERDLGNFYIDDLDDEDIRYTLDIPRGNWLIFSYTSDGDNGRFLIITSKNNKDKELIRNFYNHVSDPSGWDPIMREI